MSWIIVSYLMSSVSGPIDFDIVFVPGLGGQEGVEELHCDDGCEPPYPVGLHIEAREAEAQRGLVALYPFVPGSKLGVA